jgi:hypothetical protein
LKQYFSMCCFGVFDAINVAFLVEVEFAYMNL